MRILRRERLSAFWMLNLGAWIAYGLASFAGALPYVGLVPHLNSVRSVLVGRAAFVLIGLLSTYLLRSFFQRRRKRFASLLETAAWAVPLSYSAGLAATAFANWTRQAAGGLAVGGWAPLFGGTISAFATYLCWCACYFAAQSYRDMQAEQQNALRASATAHEAQLMALRGQLNPHFLFNSLNSIQALIDESPARAQRAVGQLASLLRHSLGQSASAVVPVREEIEVILKYLAIEKIRFEENLILNVEVEPHAAQWFVPGFLLHPLVENAVRYGMQTSAMPLQVSIRASTSNEGLRLEVANTGRWLNADRENYLTEGNGIGLRLVREQLEMSYRGRYQSACFADGGWVVQRIEITSPTKEQQDALSRAAGR
jgi:two-component system, LytTR family, sensor kinase